MTFNPIADRPCMMKKDTKCHQDFSDFNDKKTCFIACPFSDEIKTEKSIIEEILKDMDIAPLVSADYQKLGIVLVCAA